VRPVGRGELAVALAREGGPCDFPPWLPRFLHSQPAGAGAVIRTMLRKRTDPAVLFVRVLRWDCS